jgi:hypothetical protein
MVKKSLLVLLVLLITIPIFAPKRELYYLLEERLLKDDIIIHDEAIIDGLFSIEIKHPQIYLKGIYVAKIESVEFWSLLFYTHLSISTIQPNNMINKVISTDIDRVDISHSILDPLKVSIDGSGGFGDIDGLVWLDEKRVRVNIYDQKLISKLRALLKKDDKGWYYETSL